MPGLSDLLLPPRSFQFHGRLLDGETPRTWQGQVAQKIATLGEEPGTFMGVQQIKYHCAGGSWSKVSQYPVTKKSVRLYSADLLRM